MRGFLPILATISPCLAAPASDIPLGVEVVTGYRTGSVHRGFEPAQDLTDVQAEAEIASPNEWVLNLGGSHGTGNCDFSEAAACFDLRHETDKWTEHYHGSNGWHDAYSRLSWTCAFDDRAALTPFTGTSIPTSSGPGSNHLFAGVWFELNFRTTP